MNKTTVTAIIQAIVGILVYAGVLSPDTADQANADIMTGIDHAMGLVAVILSLVLIFQRRATAKVDAKVEELNAKVESVLSKLP